MLIEINCCRIKRGEELTYDYKFPIEDVKMVYGGGVFVKTFFFAKVCHINYVLYQKTDIPSLNSHTQVLIPVYQSSC